MTSVTGLKWTFSCHYMARNSSSARMITLAINVTVMGAIPFNGVLDRSKGASLGSNSVRREAGDRASELSSAAPSETIP